MARRDEREYREYLSEEQRSQPRGPQRGSRVGVEEGCPARKVVLDRPRQATSARTTDSGPRTDRVPRTKDQGRRVHMSFVRYVLRFGRSGHHVAAKAGVLE